MDDLLTDFQSKFLIGCALLFTNIFLHLAKMSETATQQAPVIEHQEIDVDQQHEEIDIDQPQEEIDVDQKQQEIDVDQQQTDAVVVETFENDFVFDCPELFDFKDPNDDDLGDLNQGKLDRFQVDGKFFLISTFVFLLLNI